MAQCQPACADQCTQKCQPQQTQVVQQQQAQCVPACQPACEPTCVNQAQPVQTVSYQPQQTTQSCTQQCQPACEPTQPVQQCQQCQVACAAPVTTTQAPQVVQIMLQASVAQSAQCEPMCQQSCQQQCVQQQQPVAQCQPACQQSCQTSCAAAQPAVVSCQPATTQTQWCVVKNWGGLNLKLIESRSPVMHYVPGHGLVNVPGSQDPFISRQVLLTGAVLGGSAIAAAAYLYATSGTGQKKGSSSGLSGLHNLGNTCYANALLQGLAGVPSVVRWLEGINTQKELQGGFVDELKDVILKLNDTSLVGLTFNAGGVTSALAIHKWNIAIGQEHDLYELFNVFVTTWEEELQFTKRRVLGTSLLDFPDACAQSPSTSECVNDSKVKPNENGDCSSVSDRKRIMFERCAEVMRRDALLRAPCFGLAAVQLRCCQTNCGYKKVRYDPSGVLSLAIPKAVVGTVTVETLLRKYFCMEVIRGASCDKCKETSGKNDSGLFKKQGFSKLPQCLIIRVERVGVLPSGQVFKLSDHVEFGETLDVRDLCFYRNKEAEYDRMMSRNKVASDCDSRSPEATSRIVGGATANERIAAGRMDAGLGQQYGTIDGGSFVAERREAARYRYQLRAVSEHRGVPETGHFVTYRRGIKDQHSWYLTNDSSVTRVPYSQVARSQAYMLYYERIRPNRWYRDNAPFANSVLSNICKL